MPDLSGDLDLKYAHAMEEYRKSGYSIDKLPRDPRISYDELPKNVKDAVAENKRLVSKMKPADIAQAGRDHQAHLEKMHAESQAKKAASVKDVVGRRTIRDAAGKIGKAAASAVNKTLGIEFGMVMAAVPSPYRAKSAEMKSLDELRKAADKVY